MKKKILLAALMFPLGVLALQQELERLAATLIDLHDDLVKPPVPPRDDQGLQGDNDNTLPPPVPAIDNGNKLPPVIPHVDVPAQPTPSLPPVPNVDTESPLPEIPAQGIEVEDDRLNQPLPPLPHEVASPEDDKDRIVVQPQEQVQPLNSQPSMELKHTIAKDIYSPLNKTLRTVENQTLKAIIGITNDGDMVVWGPKLKNPPTLTTFIQKNREFRYPNSDAIELKIENGKVRTEFVPYTIVNMKELIEQRQQFDELRNKFAQLATKRADVLDSAKYGSYVDTLESLIVQAQSTFKNGRLSGSLYPDSLGANTISMSDVHRLSEGLQALYKELVDTVQKALTKAQKIKHDVYTDWKSQGTPENLLEGRWDKAGQYAQVRKDLIVLPAIQIKLQSVDVSPVASLGSTNNQLGLIGTYYNHLLKTGLEDIAPDTFTDESDSDDENAVPNARLNEAEEEELAVLKNEILTNLSNWQAKLPPLEIANIKAKLMRYLKLQRKDDADWKPSGKIFGLYSYYQVPF